MHEEEENERKKATKRWSARKREREREDSDRDVQDDASSTVNELNKDGDKMPLCKQDGA